MGIFKAVGGCWWLYSPWVESVLHWYWGWKTIFTHYHTWTVTFNYDWYPQVFHQLQLRESRNSQYSPNYMWASLYYGSTMLPGIYDWNRHFLEPQRKDVNSAKVVCWSQCCCCCFCCYCCCCCCREAVKDFVHRWCADPNGERLFGAARPRQGEQEGKNHL